MDDTGFLYESLDVPGCLEQLKKEKNLKYGTKKYPTYILSWMGYMYRYIAYTRELSTQRVFSYIKQKQLYGTYKAYHGLGPEEATRRLFEANHLNPDSPVDCLAIVKMNMLRWEDENRMKNGRNKQKDEKTISSGKNESYNRETLAAFEEFEQMRNNPAKYKRYENMAEAVKDIFWEK